jgi:hypothetical protein
VRQNNFSLCHTEFSKKIVTRSERNVIFFRRRRRVRLGRRSRGTGRGRAPLIFTRAAAAFTTIASAKELKTFEHYTEPASFLAGLLVVPLV